MSEAKQMPKQTKVLPPELATPKSKYSRGPIFNSRNCRSDGINAAAARAKRFRARLARAWKDAITTLIIGRSPAPKRSEKIPVQPPKERVAYRAVVVRVPRANPKYRRHVQGAEAPLLADAPSATKMSERLEAFRL
jgi:hypothetical protein